MRIACLVVSFVAAFSVAPEGRAQVASIAGDTLVNGIIDNIKDAINTAIANLSNVVDSNTFLAVQRLRLLSSEMDVIAKNNVDNVFSNLSEAEQKVVQDVYFSLANLNYQSADVAENINNIVNNANGLIGTLPFMNRAPRLEGYGPRFSLLTANDGNLTVRFNGYFLDHRAPKMSLGGKECKVSSNTRNSVEFLCKADFDTEQNPLRAVQLMGEVGFAEEKTFFQKIKGAFTDNTQYKKYAVSQFLIPPQMGSYRAKITAQAQKAETVPRSENFAANNSHCSAGFDRSFNFSAMSGWMIDPASIKAQCNSSTKSSCQGVQNVSSVGFQYRVRIENNGDCGPRIPFTRTRSWYDGRGSAGGKVTWNDIKYVPTEVIHETAATDLQWGKDEVIELPTGSKSFALTIEQIDGSVMISNGNDSRKWFDVIGDVAGGRIIIRPKPMDVALN